MDATTISVTIPPVSREAIDAVPLVLLAVWYAVAFVWVRRLPTITDQPRHRDPDAADLTFEVGARLLIWALSPLFAALLAVRGLIYPKSAEVRR